MSANEEDKKPPATITPLDGFDGFTDEVEGVDDNDDQGASSHIIKGAMIKFTNEARWVTRDDEEISPDLELVAVDVLRIVQKWIGKRPVETVVVGPGAKIPDITALNDKCPKEEWGTDFNGKPQGPWQFQYLTYFVDLATLDRFTYPTGTSGGGIAVRDLADKVKWMRRFRGQHVYAVVTLADTFMNTKFGGRQRPHFVIKRWVQLGAEEKPALPGPTPPIDAEPAKAELPSVKTVDPPSLGEQMQDEVPYSDPIPEALGGSPKPPAPSVGKPSEQKSQTTTTKRGVTKFARR
jgi:hypothetical protein